MNKNIFTLFLFSAFVLNAQNMVTKNLGDFSILKVYNGIEVELIKSSDQKIEITGQKSESVSIKNIDNTLKISLPFSLNPNKNLAKNEVLVTIYYNKNIDIIDANEASTITAKEIRQDKLEVNAQEKAFINLVIVVKYLEVRASSGGVIKLTGTAENQQVDVDLYGIYNGFNLECISNSVVKSGTGAKAEIFAGESLNSKVSFGGSIFYKGDPEITKDKKVMGGIIQKRN